MAVTIDVKNQYTVSLPLSLPEVNALRKSPSERWRLSTCGARAVDPTWAERLMERAKVLDTVWQEGTVPRMTKREYARWCEGVSSAHVALGGGEQEERRADRIFLVS
jgi:hypothetical protein